MHGKKAFTPEMLSEPEPVALISATHDVLAEELGSLGRSIPDEMARALDENIFLFSGFKTYHELNDASRLLKDEDGGFKPFDRFLQDVQAIDAQYNQNWLYAEYNFATSSTQMAAKWADIERDGDEYDLQYRTALDGLVREEHAALEGITLPPSDKFWNEYYPPNGWNCRCTAVQVLHDKYPLSDSDAACEAGERATTQIGKNGENKAAMFRFNPGKAGKVFPPKHPYYKAPAEAGKKVNAIVATMVTSSEETAKKVQAQKEYFDWVNSNLPKVKVGKFTAYRFDVKFDGIEAIINKNSYKEIANKGKSDDDYIERLSVAQKIHLNADKFIYLADRDEEGRDHPDAVFKSFQGEIDGFSVLIKLKCNRDGNILWALEIIEKAP